MQKSIHHPDYKKLLRLLRRAREDAGLTQEEVAIKLDEHQSFVSKYESGERRLDLVELRWICKALGINLSTLVKQFEKACQ